MFTPPVPETFLPNRACAQSTCSTMETTDFLYAQREPAVKEVYMCHTVSDTLAFFNSLGTLKRYNRRKLQNLRNQQLRGRHNFKPSNNPEEIEFHICSYYKCRFPTIEDTFKFLV